MKSETLQAIAAHLHPGRILIAVLMLGVTWAFLRLLRGAADLLARRFARYRLFIFSLYPVLRLLIWIGVVAFVIFAVFRPPLNTLLTIGASAGLAVGLGAQDLIRNVIAGILVLVDRPFRVGDMVAVGDHYGEVTNIGLRSVQLRTFDDSAVILPNSLVLGQAVVNSNGGALEELVVMEITLPAGVDVKQIKALCWEAAACSPYAFLKKPLAVVVEDRFDRAFLTVFKIKAYVLDIRYERRFASDVIERLKGELAARGLQPPCFYPAEH